MRRHFIVLGMLLFILVSFVQADGNWSIDLVAGQNSTIGTVDFEIAGDTLTATFNVTAPGWCLTTTHLYVSNVAPVRHSPGRFQYKNEGLDCVTSDTYVVPTPDGDVFVAAHADSEYDGSPSTDTGTPLANSGLMTVDLATASYFDASLDIEGLLDSYPAWCVDLEHFITPGETYEVTVNESGNALVDNPDNLDLILYVVNQDYSSIGATAEDVQIAIWLLIDDAVPDTITFEAIAIYNDAIENGEGFVPGCGQLAGVFMDPGPDVQNIMVTVPVQCDDGGRARSETAWGLADWGVAFQQGWGMYFQLVDASESDVPLVATEEEPPTEVPVVDAPPIEHVPPTEPTEAPVVDAPQDNDNRARNDEAPGQDPNNSAPGTRSDESQGQGQNNSNNNNANTNNGNSNGNNGKGNGNG